MFLLKYITKIRQIQHKYVMFLSKNITKIKKNQHEKCRFRSIYRPKMACLGVHIKIPAAGVLVSFYEFLFEALSYCY